MPIRVSLQSTRAADSTTYEIAAEKEHLFEWCHQNLEDVQIAEIQEEALEIAAREINAPAAREKLLEVFVNFLIRNAEENRFGGGQ